ncbi:putative signal transducing protein [Zavarzinia sp. CC-PAN008]|uniref:putative signal transducing protein n=1 Tax=Zavarzinia sp. CC-PAN008 TaxID=3243332 RepID=UPI003F743349
MVELLRTNDIVLLSFCEALLRDAGIESVVFDSHTSGVEGSLGILPRRLMVLDEDAVQARAILRQAELLPR